MFFKGPKVSLRTSVCRTIPMLNPTVVAFFYKITSIDGIEIALISVNHNYTRVIIQWPLNPLDHIFKLCWIFYMAAIWSFFSKAFTRCSSDIYSTSYSSIFETNRIWDAKQFFKNTR